MAPVWPLTRGWGESWDPSSRPTRHHVQYAAFVTDDEAGLPSGIGAPATRALTGAGYAQLSQLAGVPVSELEKLHGMGPKALRVLQEALEETGRSLG